MKGYLMAASLGIRYPISVKKKKITIFQTKHQISRRRPAMKINLFNHRQSKPKAQKIFQSILFLAAVQSLRVSSIQG